MDCLGRKFAFKNNIGFRESLFGRASIPVHRLRIVLFHTLPPIVEQTETRLGAGNSLLGRAARPQSRGLVVLLDAASAVVHETEGRLSMRVTLLGGTFDPNGCLSVGLRHAEAEAVHDTEIVLGTGVAGLREWRQNAPGGLVVTAFKRRSAGFVGVCIGSIDGQGIEACA